MPNFNCSGEFGIIEILGSNKSYDFWGDHINYRSIEDYTARGRFVTRTDLTAPLWSGVNNFKQYITGETFSFSVNNVILGTGKITSFSAEGGQDISNKIYNVGFQILKSGDLSFMTGQLYTGYSTAVKNIFPYLNNLTENVEFSQQNNKTVDFSRSLDIDLERGYNLSGFGVSGLQTAILNTLCDFGVYHPIQPSQYFDNFGVKQRGYTSDLINNKYSYSESYSYQSGMNWVWDYSHSLNYGQNGISTASENGKLTSTRTTGDKLQWATSGWNSVKTGIFGRISKVYSRWSGVYNSTCGFTNDPTEQSLVYNKLAGTIDYSQTFNNDVTNYSGYYWSYETSISQSQDGWAEVSENGNLRGKKNQTGIIDTLVSQFSGIEAGIPGRVQDLYDSTIPFFKNTICSSGYSATLTELGDEKTYTENPPSIDYNYNFTDDPSYFATGNFRRIKTTYQDKQPVHLVNLFDVINDAQIAQGAEQSTLGVLSSNVEIIGKTSVPISDYVARALAEIRIPSGVNYISDYTYSFDPFSRQFSLNQDRTYSKYRKLNDYQIT